MSDTVRVLIEEEYGFRYWLWDTGMSAEALVTWWKGLASVKPYFYSPVDLPGSVEELGLPEDTPDEEAGELWDAMLADAKEECAGWSAHLHMDDDSILVAPGTVRHRHAGYRSTTFVAVPNDLQESE